MKTQKSQSEDILNSLPSLYYVINLISKKIIKTNDPEVKIGESHCYKQLFNKTVPCEIRDRDCICQQLIKKEEKTEFLIESGETENKKIFKALIRVLDGEHIIVNSSDISEQFRVKKELKINIKRLERAEKLADFGYWEFNLDDQIILASEGAKIIYGVPDKELYLKEIQKIPLPEFRQPLDEELENLIKGTKPYNIKYKIKRPLDGGIRHVHSVAEYSHNKNMVFGVIKNITETSAAQAALKESEHNLNLLFENMNSAFAFHKIVKDKSGKPVDYIFLHVNSKFEELVGKKRNEILNKSVLALFPETEDFWIERYGKVALTGNSITFSDYSAALNRYFDIAAYSPKKDHFAVTFNDITERIKSEKALEESLKDLKLAQQIAKIGNWQLDSDTNRVIWSEQLYTIFNRNIHLPVSKFSDIAEYLSKENYENLERLIKTSVRNGRSFELQMKINLLGGEYKWIELICNPDNESGAAGYFLRGTIQDITGSKKVEDELNKSNQLLRTVIDNIPDAIYMKDINFRKLLANIGDARNSRVENISELIGKSDYDIYPKEVADLYTEDDRKVIEKGETIINKEEVLPASDRERWVLTSKFPLRNDENEIYGLVGIARDITEIKKQQSRLGLLLKTIEQSPLLIVITNNKGIIEYVNPGFTKVSGYTFEEAVGENPRILKSGLQKPDFYKELWDNLITGKNWSGEFLNKRKDGKLYWESAVITPIQNGSSEITHFVAIKEDITEKKQMIRDLQIAKEKAEESDRLKTLFLANMSHEIRTPLNGILGFSSIICSGVDDKQKLKEFGTMIERSGQRLMSVIDDIIDISMIQSNQLKLSYETFDINNLLDEMYYLYQTQKGEKLEKLKFHLKYCEVQEHRFIYSDKNRIYQVVKNLLDNAFKFTETGYIKFGCSGSMDDELILFVEDTGPGIEESKTKIIFESFRQANEGHSRKYDGSGLGLAIISGILNKLGGKIGVESQLNRGSLFYVNLPRNNPGRNGE